MIRTNPRQNRRVFRATLIVSLLLAVRGTALSERLPIRVYTSADGLPRDHINRIVPDSRGFLWFCTTEGLSRFDGYSFVNYGIDQGLPSRYVYDFLESGSGVYWVATGQGLCRFSPEASAGSGRAAGSSRFVVYYPSENTRAQVINVIVEDRAGAIWCGTDEGLYRLDQVNGQWVFSFVDIIQPSPGYDRLRIRAILEDRRGSLWVSAESGLHRRRPDGVVEVYAARDGLPIQNALLEDGAGRIWAATAYGLYQLVSDPGRDRPIISRVYTARDGVAHNGVLSLCQSKSGELWVGTPQGLSELLPASGKGGDRFRSYTEENGLSDPNIIALAEDHDGNLWMGTSDGGAMRLAAKGFATYKKVDGLGGLGIGSIFEDRAGELCVFSSEGSLNRLDGERFIEAQLRLPRGIAYRGWGWNQVMFQDSRGEWWVNTGQGLVRYPRLARIEQITRTPPKAIYTTRNGLAADEIFRLYEDSRGDIWISTLGNINLSLTRWERATESFHRYPPGGGLLESAASAFCEDRSGNLWIGFYSGGIARYSQGRFTAFTKSDGVPAGFVEALYCDHAGRLWVATAEGGLGRVDAPGSEHPSMVTYSRAEGLASNQANCVTEDQWGMIYIGTGRGVDKLDPATGHIKHFTTADGLASSFVDVAFRHRDGSLWFGTLQGLSRLIPQPEGPTPPPPLIISGVRIAGVPYPLPELGDTAISLPELAANQNNLEINFAGLSLAVGESLRYQYRLEGASSEWSPPTGQRTVSYPNLGSGKYRFLVRAVSADGTVSESPAFVSFRVLPPVWERWWFVLLASILVAIPIGAVARYRHQRKKAVREAEEALRRSREERLTELEQVRRRIATDLHDDIGSSLSQIYLLSQVARQRVGRTGEDAAEPLNMIANVSNEMVSSMSDIVWAINPRKDHLSDLIHRMRRFASDTFAAGDIAFRFHAPDPETDIRLGANIRREVFLIFKESINNLVKHSACGEAEIEFETQDDCLLLRVTDNGNGFDAGLDSDGHGLGSMRERAGSIGGRLDLVSKPGEGTTVALRVPLGHPPAPDITANAGGNRAR